MTTRYFGQPVPRNEDARLLTGRALFVDDVELPGMLHAAFVRSPHAHARIRAIDVAAASKAPGVVGIVTGKDLAECTTSLRMAPPIAGLHPVAPASWILRVRLPPRAVNKNDH
jgi:aerobic carbon-monoxide dehydrogenase large subunit